MKHQMKINKYLLLPMAAATLGAALTGCDENAWNNHLDGFDENSLKEITQVETVEYTLITTDYSAIASNATNKALAEEQGIASALASVKSKNCFNEKAKAEEFVPAYLASTSFPYFTLSNGSAVKLTYNVSEGLPDCLAQAEDANQVLITEEQYQGVWESDQDYISAFAPSHPASRSLPALLKESLPDAQSGDYAIVTYAEAEQEPVFTTVGGGEDEEQFQLSSTIGSVAVGDQVQVCGVITGICTRGYVVTDASGSIFVYVKSGFDTATHPVGTQVNITGTVSSYNFGFQIDGSSMEETVVGTQDVATLLPAPKAWTGPELDAEVAARVAAGGLYLASYASMTGTIVFSGNNINVVLPDGTTAQGSPYFITDALKAQLVEGATMTVEGWWIAIAGKKYCSLVVNTVKAAPTSAPASRSLAAEVPTVEKYAVYQFNGTKWTVPSDFAILSPADYASMGQKYGNVDSNSVKLLPTWLKVTFPYAQADDFKYVLYKYYNGSSTSYRADMFVYDSAEWTREDGIHQVTNQFVRANGKWIYDPTVTITLTSGKSQPLSSTYYQACVDWVYNEICVPLGDTSITSGKFYVTSYGNNEYYSGTSAYQNNVDLRAGSARSQYEAGWEGYTDEQIVATMKQRFTHEVMPGALKTLHADAAPIDGLDLYYVINFWAYDGSATTPYVVRYKVVGPATFEFVDCSWDE